MKIEDSKMEELYSILMSFREFAFGHGNISNYSKQELCNYQEEIKDFAMKFEKISD